MSDQGWVVKDYPEDRKKSIDEIVAKTLPLRKELDSLDLLISRMTNTPDPEDVLDWARKAAGLGNQLRKIQSKVISASKNEEASRIMEIKLECELKEIKFVATIAQADANRYIMYLRLARNVLEAYVTSADNIISICRMHLGHSNSIRETDIQ